MLAGLGAAGERDLWSRVQDALGPAADSASAVASRMAADPSLSVTQAIVQASAAGEIDPGTAALVSEMAGQVARGARSVQRGAAAAGVVSRGSQMIQGIPNWALYAAGALVLYKVLK